MQQAELGESGRPVVQGVPVSASGGTVVGVPVSASDRPVLLGVTPGALPHAVAIVPTLPPQEVVVLSYRSAVFCFAIIDMFTTMLNLLSLLSSEDGSWFTGALGLVFLFGPLAGLIGSNRLNRPAVTVYFAFCMLKLGYQVFMAVRFGFLWFFLLALIQMWITKIVGTFCFALGAIPPERRPQLLEVDAKDGVRMVYW